METRLYLIVVWFHWKLRTKTEGNCSGRSRVRRILLTCIQLLFLQFLYVIWSTPTNSAFSQKHAKCVYAYDSWKQCQWIIWMLVCKHKIWGNKLVIFEALFKSLPSFQSSWNLQGIFIDNWSRDFPIYENIYRAVFEKCKICRHGPNYLQKL